MVMHHMAPPRMCVNRTKSLISAQLPAEMAQSETIPTIWIEWLAIAVAYQSDLHLSKIKYACYFDIKQKDNRNNA